jgi:hypothetical protein
MKLPCPIKNHRAGLWRITESDRENLLQLLFQRYPDGEWGTFFRFGFRRAGWGILITWVDSLKPGAGDLDRRSPLVEFRAGYIQRAMAALDDSELGIGVIHSHPKGCAPLPSPADDDMDSYFALEFERFESPRPYASVIVARDRRNEVSFSGRVFDRGIWLPLANCLVNGKRITRECPFSKPNAPTSGSLGAKHGSQARLAQLLGEDAPHRLRNAVVGIVGCSGTGTPAIHVLARAEIGEIVMVDPGYYKPSNHQRNHASRHADLFEIPAPAKVGLASRLVKEINPAITVTGFQGDLLDDAVLNELVRCDLILGCTDSNYARAALGDIASHYLVPVLDLAAQMRAENGSLQEQIGEIARYGPGLPCPWCRRRISPNAIRYETATNEEREFLIAAAEEAEQRGIDGRQYWGGAPPPELTVGYLTTVIGAMGAGYAQNLLLGCSKLPHDRFQLDLGMPFLGAVADERPIRAECHCGRYTGWADQAQIARSVTFPRNWPRAVRVD